jgi:nicotinamidase/pyrazinamidase
LGVCGETRRDRNREWRSALRTLILVDIQNDFLPGGALAVPEGDRVVPVANRLMPHFDLIVATQDWHPAHHESFASQRPGHQVGDVVDVNGLAQTLWPDHCVQGTEGAELVSGLKTERIAEVFRKGIDPGIDSYSGFYDNAWGRSTGLEEYLRERNVERFHLMGLATDYCVKFTALDARKLGFRPAVVLEGVRGVELHPGDCERAFEEMKSAGVELVPLADIE